MASSTVAIASTSPAAATTATVASREPLPSFQQLNAITYLYTPSSTSSSAATEGHPALIVLCSWMNAETRHIVKYITRYQALFPASPILLLRSWTSSFFFNTRARRRREMGPAVNIIRTYVPSSAATAGKPGVGSGKADETTNGAPNGAPNGALPDPHAPSKPSVPGLLVHAFSNGGCGQLALLAEQHVLATLGALPLPASAVILDSGPGLARFRSGMHAFSLGLPSSPLLRWPAQALIAALLVVAYMIPRACGMQTLDVAMRGMLNAVGGRVDGTEEEKVRVAGPALLRREACRTYVYSDADPIIDPRDVEAHAEEAERRGAVVRRERWVGSPHVGHMRVDPERYWAAVQRAWEERG